MSTRSQPLGRPASASTTLTKEEALGHAETIIETIRHGDPLNPHDSGHRFCANCHIQLREIEPPKPEREFFDRWGGDWSYSETRGLDVTNAYVRYEDSPETAAASIGRAYPTQHTQHGEVDRPSSIRPGESIVSTGLICECGATRHTQIERPVPKHQAVRFARNLSKSVDTLRLQAKNASRDELADRAEAWKHSRDVLVETVRRLKSRGDMKGKPIFTAALAVALRRPNQ